MTMKELEEHLQQGECFVVVGGAVYFKATDYAPGVDPHEWYRDMMCERRFTVHCLTIEEYLRERHGLSSVGETERAIDCWQAAMNEEE